MSRARDFFTAEDGRIYEGWKVVGGSASVLLLATGSLVYGLGVVFEPIKTELALSTFTVSILFSLRSEVGGIAAPFVGMALDRVGPQSVVRVGVTISAAGCLLLSFATGLWVFVPAMLLIAVGQTAGGGQVGNHAVASWFRRRRGRAMSAMTLGGAAGGLVAVVVGVGVNSIGWRATLRILAVVILIGGHLLARFVRSRPLDHHQPIDGYRFEGENPTTSSDWDIPFGEAVRSKAFRLLLMYNIVTDFSRLAYLTHLANFVASDLGGSASMAGVVVGVSGVASIPGRLGSGYFADRMPVRVVAAATMVPFIGGVALLSVATEPWHAVVAAVLGGIGFGASVPVRPALYVNYFGMSIFGRIMGTGRLLSTTGGAAGGAIVGLMVDRNDGSYSAAWLVALAVGALSIPLALLAKPPTELHERYSVAPNSS
ncbi:MAG: sugar phosphate permease [Candidatus Poriferisodalaceae bacterium]